MAAEWRIEEYEKPMARKVCSRVYETIDDLAEEFLNPDGAWDQDTADVLEELKGRLQKVLPFDPPIEEERE